ncbi:hypothetical protein N8610_02745, partial [Akkermansiaceae bacterium]|nr:hypothetical protein [Akkermansiaceae bacterium]
SWVFPTFSPPQTIQVQISGGLYFVARDLFLFARTFLIDRLIWLDFPFRFRKFLRLGSARGRFCSDMESAGFTA